MAKISETDLILNKDGSVYHLSLKPGQVADTIIAVGDPSRVYSVSRHFDDVDFEMNKREFITHTGTYKGKSITVISTGIGTDNIEIFFTEVDALFNIDLKKREPRKKRKSLNIIRIGTSAALQEDIEVGSHLVSNYAVGFDSLMVFYDFKQNKFENEIIDKLQKDLKFPFRPYMAKCSAKLKKQIGVDMVEGNSVTTPGFYAPQGRNITLIPRYPKLLNDLSYFHLNDFWLTNFEMETGAYYALGKLFGHEVLSVNAIIVNRIKEKFSKDPSGVIDSLIKIVLGRL